ncbi:MAG: methyltransferase [Paracoccus sp. (in: a-proteobacteria)]|uniref:class I SAM-dependent methyltransferase n=1 Tax=Paracoccus sp. TaxID=267 RepID=UPI0026E0068B|nr:methyltransferase [Paracoccus sp. (in: a-proteobacteria)]MDO5620592.1 methyltransferase [Paracoccus sp. (in: a-proteobacteria)]
MARSRLSVGLDAPVAGRVVLFGADAAQDLSMFDPAQTVIVQPRKPDHDQLAAQGFDVRIASPEAADLAVVFIDRARDLTRARIAAAAAILPAGASLWVDGQKTDGIDSVLKELRGLVEVEAPLAGAHGKLARLTVPQGAWLPEDWAARPRQVDGFVTAPGVFSADGADPGSVALAAALPDKLPTRIVELGAGWGWLAAQILARPGVTELHLVESDAVALDCARQNVTDPRTRFHWADATRFTLPEPVNGVIMNPPFHQSRRADPRLGAAFIRTAAGLLTGAGRLWMVANRHLPYETVLAEHFAQVEAFGGDSRFKLLTATGAGRRKHK